MFLVSFEHHRISLGIGETNPHNSWRFDGNTTDWEQASYNIEITRGENTTREFSSVSSNSLFIPWPDALLGEAEAANVRVRAHGQDGQPSTPWSDWASVEIGLFNFSWAHVLLIAPEEYNKDLEKPKRPQYFRKNFELPPDIITGRLYITALGLYEAEINGQRVGDHVLAPGWQSYNFRHVYDTYDVTNLLVDGGANVVGVVVGEGWYSGRIGYSQGQYNIYGDSLGLVSVLEVTLQNGTKIRIPTDTSWKVSNGPILESQIYDGETFDQQYVPALEDWSTPSYNDDAWNATRVIANVRGKLVSPDQPPVRRIQEIKPQRIFQAPSGETLLDFGQNLVGWLRIQVEGPAGTNITIRHAEVLEPNGELAVRPLREAKAREIVLLSGDGEIEYKLKFTCHGFQFAGISGWPANSSTPLDIDHITAIVIHTDMEETGWFECSHGLLNKLHSNVRWSMKGNFVSIPTDCPQRDERLGWTGDVHAFVPTSNYLYNTTGFWKNWHRDVWSEMARTGEMVVPAYVPLVPRFDIWKSTSYWGDVVVGNLWNIYQSFGDLSLLRDHLPQAQNWMDVGIPRNEIGLWDRTTFQFADWLDPLAPADAPGNATTDRYLVSDAYLVEMTRVLSTLRALSTDPAWLRTTPNSTPIFVMSFGKPGSPPRESLPTGHKQPTHLLLLLT
ncbi:hypothetical protein ACJ41O_010514 [Fusarium nematophilum]